MKKVLSLVLVIAMVLSSMSFAFAGTFPDVTGDYEDAVEALVALGVVNGYEDGTFKPENTIKRAELAKLLVEALGYKALVAGASSNFADTQMHWANGHVAIAAGTGLVMGYPDGTFAPEKPVTYDEVYTMVIRALGYTDASLKGTWPTNYKVKAIDLGLTDDVVMNGSAADRGGVAQIIYNALEAYLVEVDADNAVTKIFVEYDDDDNAVYKMLIDKIASKVTIDTVLPKHVDADDDDNYYGDIVDLTQYMYQKIDAYTNDDDEVVFVTKNHSDVVEGVFEKDTATDRVGIDVDSDDNEYDLASESTKVYYNGKEVMMTEGDMEGTVEDSDFTDLIGADVIAVLNDDDEITAMITVNATGAKQATKSYNGKALVFAGIDLPLNSDDDAVDFDDLTVTGAVDDLTDVEEDDVLVAYVAGGYADLTVEPATLTIEVVRDTVEGKITKKNSDGDFYIGGTYYETSKFASTSVVEVGNEGTFYLDNKGDIFAFDEDDSTDPVDYAIITEVVDGVYYSDTTIVLQKPEITLVNAQGEEVTYLVDRDSTDADLLNQNDDMDVVVEMYDIVKYTIEDGMITKVTVKNTATVDPTTYSAIETDSAAFVLASNALVFNFVDNTVEDDEVELVNASDLGDDVNEITRIENSNGEIELIFVNGTGTAADTYAYITDDATIINDDDDKVQEIMGYVDGKAVSYETNALSKVAADDIDAAKLFMLTFEDGIVTGAQDVTSQAIVDTAVTKVSGSRFRTGAGTTLSPYVWYTLADDVVVYVLDDGEFNYVGDASSVYDEAYVMGFAFDDDNNSQKIIEILFIME